MGLPLFEVPTRKDYEFGRSAKASKTLSPIQIGTGAEGQVASMLTTAPIVRLLAYGQSVGDHECLPKGHVSHATLDGQQFNINFQYIELL